MFLFTHCSSQTYLTSILYYLGTPIVIALCYLLSHSTETNRRENVVITAVQDFFLIVPYLQEINGGSALIVILKYSTTKVIC